MSKLLIIAFVGTFTFILGKYFQKKTNSQKTSKVSTGFGVILPIFLIFPYLFLGNTFTSEIKLLSLLFIFITGLIYYIDDVRGLPPSIRLFLSSISGLFIINIYLNNFVEHINVFTLYIFAVGIMCLLTNVFNFYDGADLNLSTTIFLFGLSLINYQNLMVPSLILIGFSIGFSLINRKKDSLYLGDSGSYVFACIVFLILISSSQDIKNFPINSIYTIILPIYDVLYVLLIRLIKGHDLLTRNYLHIYQRLNIEYQGFYYLLPQIIHFVVAFTLNKVLNYLNIFNQYENTMLICFVYTPTFYLLTRKYFVSKNYFFGDGTNNE